MKALKRTSVSAVMVLFLGVGLSYAQNPAKQISDKGLEYAAEGKFTEAREEFEKALKTDAFYEPAKRSLKIIEDVIAQKIEVETSFHLFRGAVYHNRGQLSKAIAEFNKAIEINPKYAPVYNNRGFAHIGKGDYDQAMMYSILNEEPEPITGLRTGIPLELERVVNKTLAKNPSERYQHVDEIPVDLKNIDQTSSVVSSTSFKIKSEKQKAAKKYPAFLFFISWIIILILSVIAIWGLTRKTEKSIAM